MANNSSIWKNAVFMRMFCSYSISMLGRWFDMVAIMILFGYVWETDPLTIALIPVMYALPHALLSQFAGILADRFNKGKLMMMADVGTAVLTIVLAMAPGPWLALPILLLRATLTVIHFPAQQALIKHVVEENLIVKAVTLNGTVNEFTKIMGPILGGSLAAIFSPRLCILINAAAYFISALILLSIIKKREVETSRSAEVEAGNKASFWQSWKDGWSMVLSSKILVVAVTFSLLGMTAIQMTDVQITVLLREIAPERPEMIGWVMASSGAGALAVMMLMNRFKKIAYYGVLIGSSFLLIGVPFGMLGLLETGVQSFVLTGLGFAAGIGIGIYTIVISYILQKETARENIGRVSGIYNSLSGMVVLGAPLLGGMLVGLFDVRLVYLGVGLSLSLIGLTSALLQQVLWQKNEGISVKKVTVGMKSYE
ncbi:MFS transporter [Salipaludibacillus aurantiacus]|uniref:Predicted arabinose efflux permease, MFS family n=1 Tax=Salipaludibacillus aurantiacus TaxID=1601833 RepID=A0A1H9UTD6_9BACI|nr:MFS transporter [Salipaludibacillus aurantiacus]SES12394.1 Predicted arabinose efflux permease, MFS family [Salipaludibacillus aurantiacus]